MKATPDTYRFPETYASMTMHRTVLSEPMEPSLSTYFDEYGYGLIADLISIGVESEVIENAVNSSEIKATPWPKVERKTDFYWREDEKALGILGALGERAIQYCYGQSESEPVGGNFVTVGAEIGSQQLALAGLIYAREQGRLREISELDNGQGPLYVVRDSFSARMFDIMMPEAE